MFDPTAFDNMKVVIEGALYDLDLNGEIAITDRNDIVNMAKMSRQFELKFGLKEEVRDISAKLILESSLVNLAAELLPSLQPENLAGCQIELQFFLRDTGEISDFNELQNILIEIWGNSRKISQSILYNPLIKEKDRLILIKIEFDRLIREEQIDDLIELIEFMVSTIKRLHAL